MFDVHKHGDAIAGSAFRVQLDSISASKGKGFVEKGSLTELCPISHADLDVANGG